jgi:hypothetical protein
LPTRRHERRIRALDGRRYRFWGTVVSALAWTGFVAAHLAGAPHATAVLAAVDALTWGFALGVLLPTDDGVEFSVVSVATSASLLVLGGVFLVELRLTGAFFWSFVCIGALSLFVQLLAPFLRNVSLRRRTAPPQPVPSLIDSRPVSPKPVPAMVDGSVVWELAEFRIPIPELFGKPPAPIPELRGPEPVSVPSLEVSRPKVWRAIGWSIPLTLIGLALAIGAASGDRHLAPGLWGLPGSISPTWYVGLALIVAGIGTARRNAGLEMGVAVTALVLVLTGTAAVVYDVPRLAWAQKHLGIVGYILHYGQVHPDIDIYQAWPGLFSATAWLTRSGSIGDPLTVARIWPPLVDLAELIAVRCFAGRLLGNNYRAWAAAGVFMLAAAFNEDYFSPQAIALFLALSLYAVVVPIAQVGTPGTVRYTLPAWRIGVVVVLSLGLAVTHQITPYFVVAALFVLVVFGLLRPVWIPLVPLIPAAAWAAINYQTWKGYFSFSKILDLGSNVSTPGAAIVGEHPDVVQRVSTDALAAGPFVVGVLAVLFLVRNRRRPEIALAFCAASAGSLVLFTSYGQEGIYRTTIFALPWLAVLALGGGSRTLFRRSITLVPLFALLATTFLLANFALDGKNVVSPAELQAERHFELNASPGSRLVYVGAQDDPYDATFRYTVVQAGQESLDGKDKIGPVVTSLAQMGRNYPHFYVATTQAGVYAGELYGFYTPQYYDSFVAAMRASPDFKTVSNQGGTQVFEFKSTNRP